MKRIIPALIAILVLQVALALFTWSGNEKGENVGTLLAAFQTDQIDHITLFDHDKKEMKMIKKKGKWLLPDHFATIADGNKIADFLQKVSALKAGWPVATSDSAATRFQVSKESFKVKIVLQKGTDTLMTLYIGDSAGVRSAYLRVNDSKDIYRSNLAAYDFPVNPDKWIDSSLLKQDEKEISKLRLNDVVLSRGKDGFILDGVDGQKTDKAAAQKLISTLANLVPDSILGLKEKPSYNLTSPVLLAVITKKDGSTVKYRFGKQTEKENSYILKISDQVPYYKIAKWRIRALIAADRKTLTKQKTVKKEPEIKD